MDERKSKLLENIVNLELTPDNIERNFCLPIENSFDCESIWYKFIKDTNVHLGQRSGGWLFCWNFHDSKFYSNKEQLLEYIRSGRVVNEYGEELEVEEFINMALTWEQPDGKYVNPQYRISERMKGMGLFYDNPRYDDRIVDGLRVSSSTDFC